MKSDIIPTLLYIHSSSLHDFDFIEILIILVLLITFNGYVKEIY